MNFHREIVFYDYEFNVIGTSLHAADIYHKELYNGIGSFEAELDLSEGICAELMKRDYVVAVWDKLQAIVTSVKAVAGEGTLKVYGRTPNWLLSKRACPDFDQKTGTPFALAQELVKEVWGDAISEGEGGDIAAEETVFWRNVYNPLSEVVADCLDRAEGGHRVVYDTKNKLWRFDVYKGEERKLIFSYDRKNVSQMSVSHSVLDSFNGGFYLKDDDNGEWGEIASDKEGIYKWTARLDASGESSARSELEKKGIENEIELTAQNLFRSNGYELGDIVRAVSETGGQRLVKKMRVGGVERWAGYNDFGERPILIDTGSEDE